MFLKGPEIIFSLVGHPLLQLLTSATVFEAASDKTYANGRGFVLIKSYLQKQWGWGGQSAVVWVPMPQIKLLITTRI